MKAPARLRAKAAPIPGGDAIESIASDADGIADLISALAEGPDTPESMREGLAFIERSLSGLAERLRRGEPIWPPASRR